MILQGIMLSWGENIIFEGYILYYFLYVTFWNDLILEIEERLVVDMVYGWRVNRREVDVVIKGQYVGFCGVGTVSYFYTGSGYTDLSGWWNCM